MSKVFIIAEAGVNHNGSVELAKKIVDAAKDAGADCIKFQTFKAEHLAGKNSIKADYQIINTDNTQSQFEMLKELELRFQDFAELKKYCDKRNIMFISSPFDIESVDFLASIGVEIFKIPSGEITNLPYLRKINSYQKKVILSTGMSDLNEIQSAIRVLVDSDISLLHCTTEYPCPFEYVNMRALETLKEKFGLPIGYSDHTEGIEISVMAVSMGATIIEKHFTLDKNMVGPDHKASLEPEEFKLMVNAVRNVEKAFGNGEKKLQLPEKKNILIVRKSIVAKTNINKGEIYTEDNLTCKRPGNGISPMKWDELVGQHANRNYKKDEFIKCERFV